jgi:hypothetical protein
MLSTDTTVIVAIATLLFVVGAAIGGGQNSIVAQARRPTNRR